MDFKAFKEFKARMAFKAFKVLMDSRVFRAH